MKNLKTQEEIMVNWKGDIEKPIVSILCLTYNHQPYIEEAIEGFLAQETDFPFEIIIHDDASTDKTADIVREYEAKYPKLIKPIYQTKNRFSQGLRNGEVIYPKARGEYFAYCEGDDYWTDSKKLQIQKDFLDKNKDYSMCFHETNVFIQEKNKIRTSTNKLKDKDVYLEDFLLSNQGRTCSFMYRSNKIKLLEIRKDLKFGDWIQHILQIQNSKARYLSRNMAVYRVHSGGVWSGAIQKDRLLSEIKMLEFMDEYLNFKYSELIYQRIGRNLFEISLIYMKNNQKFIDYSFSEFMNHTNITYLAFMKKKFRIFLKRSIKKLGKK